jgi:LPXTG-motif cell wall-anchored protein
MCLGIQQAANTGNVANQQGLSQYNSEADNVDFGGSGIDITPDLTVECNQTIVQAAAAGNPLAQAAVQSGALAPPASAPVSAPVAAVASGGGAGPSIGLPAARGAGLTQLPRTGGLMTLPLAVLGLSGIGGGLLFWRLRR